MNFDTAHKAVRNTFFSGLRLATGMLSTLVTSAIIARTLGPVSMGVYSYAMWLVGVLGILANIGLPAAITKYISEFVGSGDLAGAVQTGRKLLRAQFIVAAGVSGVTACFVLLKTPHRSIIILAAIMILAQALLQSLGAALAGIQRFDQIALVGLYVGLGQSASITVAALLHAGINGMLLATLAGLWLGAGLYYRAVERCLLQLAPDFSSSSAQTADVWRRIIRFSLTISYILLLDAIVWQRSEVLFLKWYSTLPEIAFYTIAYSMAAKLNDLSSVVSSMLLPLYSESYGRHGLDEVGDVFASSLKYLQMFMAPVCMLGVAVARPLVQLIYGSEYLSLVLPLRILIVSVILTSLGAINSTLLVGTEKQSFIAKYGTVIAVLNVTLDLLLIPRHGALGAAIANCSAQIAGAIGGTVYALHYLRVRFPWRPTLTIYGAAATAVVPADYYLKKTQNPFVLISLVLAAAAVYLTILTAAREIGKRDLRLLRKVFFKGNVYRVA